MIQIYSIIIYENSLFHRDKHHTACIHKQIMVSAPLHFLICEHEPPFQYPLDLLSINNYHTDLLLTQLPCPHITFRAISSFYLEYQHTYFYCENIGLELLLTTSSIKEFLFQLRLFSGLRAKLNLHFQRSFYVFHSLIWYTIEV